MTIAKAELIELFDDEAEDGGRWMLVCRKHHHVIQFTTKRTALSFKAHPDEWCEPCMDDSTYCYTCEVQFPAHCIGDDGTVWLHEGHRIGKGMETAK
jgi:hypothetical protein